MTNKTTLSRCFLLFLIFSLSLTGCELFLPAGPVPRPRYTVGSPWQTHGVWHYPRADFRYVAQGLVAVYGHRSTRLTADGEAYSPDAMAAASPTLQLPAIARVTNLQNGREVVVRINDRGPSNPGRILEVTPRVADLLGIPLHGTAQIRVQELPAESEALAMSLGAGPHIKRAPVVPVTEQTLPPPGTGSPHLEKVQIIGRPTTLRVHREQEQVPAHLPATYTQGTPHPGVLYVQAGAYGSAQDAAPLAGKVSGFPVSVIGFPSQGRTLYALLVGPFATVTAADNALSRVFAAGGTDAHITVR